MVRDEAYAMGCAMIQFAKDGERTSILVCNYSLKCIPELPVYVTSSKAGGGCKEGKSSKYTSLCRKKEKYENKFYA